MGCWRWALARQLPLDVELDAPVSWDLDRQMDPLGLGQPAIRSACPDRRERSDEAVVAPGLVRKKADLDDAGL
eukprot:3849788-Rhodomonas_salina.1